MKAPLSGLGVPARSCRRGRPAAGVEPGVGILVSLEKWVREMPTVRSTSCMIRHSEQEIDVEVAVNIFTYHA